MYIRSSPRGPNRDPNRTLSNELLLFIDASFANNGDLLLQISFILVLIDYN
jgi:hypothetical protein